MELSEQQIAEIRKQIISQINSTFPEDKKSEAISRIESMSSEEIISFLEQNNLIKDLQSENSDNSEESGCIFCSIISGKIPSVKIFENSDAIAILEINPLSEGHTLVIPKKHAGQISKEIKTFAEEIESKIKYALKPKNTLLEESNLFGHQILNIIPIYGDSVEKERKKTSPEELKKIKEKILSVTEKTKEESKKIEEKDIRNKTPEEEFKIFPKRIP